MLLFLLSLTAVAAAAPSPVAEVLAEPVPIVGDNPELDPREGKKGKVYKWKSADGLPYEYYVPKGYDPEKGANITVVLHGNNLNHRWTFWNHKAGEFRADDIVISPDGTTVLQRTGNPEFLGNKADTDRMHAFLTEMKDVWSVRQTFLYGHSQGSFFVFYFAGAHPDDIDGVCGHASGMWNGTQQGKSGHHLAIGVMHGTDDHIPYGQGAYARTSYEQAKYPNVHLRTLFDWPHAPHAYQAESVLSWCEGMTSTRPDRVEACLEYLAVEDRHKGVNWSALWAVANRLSTMDDATTKQKKLGKKLAAAVNDLAEKHVAAIKKGLGKKGKLARLSKGDWSGRTIRLVEDFYCVPALDEFKKKNKKAFDSLSKDASKAMKEWWTKKDKKPKEAFKAGLDLLEKGYLDYHCKEVLTQIDEWGESAKEHGIGKADLQRWKALSPAYADGRKDGFKEFESTNKKAKL